MSHHKAMKTLPDLFAQRLVARGEVGAVYVVNWERC